MAYAEVEEIESDFKDIEFSDDSNVTSSDVEQFIVEADALIDSFLGNIYSVPVTEGSGLQLLKLLSRSIVVYRIKRLMEVKQDKNADANQNIIGVLLNPKQVMEILEKLQKKEMTLAGAVALTNSNGFYSYNSANGVCPVVKKDDVQW